MLRYVVLLACHALLSHNSVTCVDSLLLTFHIMLLYIKYCDATVSRYAMITGHPDIVI